MTDDFHRTNLHLHRTDYEFLLARYGRGWTTVVRDIIRREVAWKRASARASEQAKQTVGDLLKDKS
tara:strand:+ start:406 stop:603 length:198 start_codon:yes stop_codon:yes gene_type:complete